MYIWTHVHMYVHTDTNACINALAHTYICPWMQTQALTCGYTMCTQVHMHTRAWVNTHVHACTHTTIMCPPGELIKQILNAPVRTVTLRPPPLSSERIPPTLQSRLSTEWCPETGKSEVRTNPCSETEAVQLQPEWNLFGFLFLLSVRGSHDVALARVHYIDRAGLVPTDIHLPLPPKRWN